MKGGRVVFHSRGGLTCLDHATGEEVWTEAVQAAGTPLSGRGDLSKEVRRGKRTVPDTPSLFTGNDQPTIVLTDDMVYCAIGKSIMAKSLADGKTLWTAEGGENYMKSPDLFVADGLVWSRDLKGAIPRPARSSARWCRR